MKRTATSRRRNPLKPRRVTIGPELRAYLRKTEAFRAGRNPITLMRAAPSKFARAVAGLSGKQMRRRPTRGKWSIIEILGHLHDTEVVYGYRYRLSLSQPGSLILGYDQERWVDELHHRKSNAKRLLRQIAVLREGNLDVVLRVPRSAWNRHGMHTERGRQTVRVTLEQIAGHDLNHLDQIQAIRKKYGW